MSKKTLLVLAASIYQVPVIEAAKRLGYRVVTVDNVPANPGHALADASYNVSTRRRDDMLGIAQKEAISGIIAACTDVALPTAAYVAKKLGLSGPPVKSADIVCDKIAFRRWLNDQNLAAPQALAVHEGLRLPEGLFGEHPWILKPDRSSGSKGIFIIASEEEYNDRLPETLSFSPTSRGILEQFIPGYQITCEGVIAHGRIKAALILDRQTALPPYVVTVGHHVPSRLPEDVQREFILALEDIWSRLEITDSPFDCDAIVTEEAFYIIELSPRLGGNSIATLLKEATGFDIVEYAVRLACGEAIHEYEFNNAKVRAILLLGVHEVGGLRYDEKELESLRRETWVKYLQIDKAVGDPVLPFIDGRYRVGEALILGLTRDDLDARAMELRERLNLRGT